MNTTSANENRENRRGAWCVRCEANDDVSADRDRAGATRVPERARRRIDGWNAVDELRRVRDRRDRR